MTDDRRLEDKLTKLSNPDEPVGTGGRTLSGANKVDLRVALLTELDETILARLLAFRNDAGAILTLEVANRRLLRVSDTSTLKHPSLATLVGQVFTETGGPLVNALDQLLDHFLSDTKRLLVQSTRLARAPDPSVIGCAPQTLAQGWSLNLQGTDAAAATTPLADFRAACADIATAWLDIDTGIPGASGGDPDQVAHLATLAATLPQLDAALARNMPDTGTASCIILGTNEGVDASVLLAKSGPAGALMIIPNAYLADAIAAWRSLQT